MARAQIARQLSEHSGALFAFLARGWASFAGLVLVLLATTRLDAAEQGYFFTFQTLLQFQFLPRQRLAGLFRQGRAAALAI